MTIQRRTCGPLRRPDREPRPSATVRGLRSAWWTARVVPILVSAYVWLMVIALAPWTGWLLLAACTGYALAWCHPTVLRVVWGLRPAGDREQERLLRALVPLAALRGRRQPRVWVSRRAHPSVAMPTDRDVVFSSQLVSAMVAGRVPDLHVAARVAHAFGQSRVHGAAPAAVDLFCLPAHLLAVPLAPVGRLVALPAARVMATVVMVIAIVQSVAAERWVGVIGVSVLLGLSFLAPRWHRDCAAALEGAGDATVVENGLGEAWLQVLRNAGQRVDAERALRLRDSGTP